MPDDETVVFKVDDFLGLVTDVDDKDLAPGASPLMKNMALDTAGQLTPRRGLAKVDSTEAAGGMILSMTLADFALTKQLVWNTDEGDIQKDTAVDPAWTD